MTEFKVGDKVRILDVDKILGAVGNGFKNGGIYSVVGIDDDGCPIIENEKEELYFYHKELQYIEKVEKTTKNQRITALEKEIAELRSLKEKVGYLEQAVQQYFAVPGEHSTVEDKPKTASQEANDFQKIFSALEAGHDLGVIDLPLYVFDSPDSYKERVLKIYQILRDGKTPNVYAYAILDMVRAAFDLTER